MTRTLTLLIKETLEFAKIKRFLNSKSRNSEQTKKGYTIALSHFQTFLFGSKTYRAYDVESIIPALNEKKIDVYNLFEDFIIYLENREDTYNGKTKLSDKTKLFYIAGVKAYLEFCDVEISAKKLRNKVTMPKVYRRRKEALNPKKIRDILLACNNPRLKAFLLVLASSGMRSMEALSLRNSDIDFSTSPAKIHIIAENTKTRQDRDIYISDEATKELKILLKSKYGSDDFRKYPTHFIFAKWRTDKIDPHGVYGVLHHQFAHLLKKIGMDKRRDGQGIQRRNLSFHTFRDYVKSAISKHTTKDFSEWFLGHAAGSTYWNIDEEEIKELYQKCMKYLTFLDYEIVEAVGSDFESKLIERDREIKLMHQKIGKLEKLEKFLKQAEGFSLQRSAENNNDVMLEIDKKSVDKMLKEGNTWNDVLDALGLKPKSRIRSKK